MDPTRTWPELSNLCARCVDVCVSVFIIVFTNAALQAAKAGANIILIQELFETTYFCQEQRADLFQLAHDVLLLRLCMCLSRCCHASPLPKPVEGAERRAADQLLRLSVAKIEAVCVRARHRNAKSNVCVLVRDRNASTVKTKAMQRTSTLPITNSNRMARIRDHFQSGFQGARENSMGLRQKWKTIMTRCCSCGDLEKLRAGSERCGSYHRHRT